MYSPALPTSSSEESSLQSPHTPATAVSSGLQKAGVVAEPVQKTCLPTLLGMKEQCERLEGHPDLTAENPSGALLYAHGAFGPLRSARVTGWGHFYSCLLTERLQAKGRGDLKAPACIRSHAQKRSDCPCSRRTASLCHIHSHRVTSGCLGLKNWDIEAHLSLQSKRKRKEESENQDICKKKGSQTNKPPRIQ